MAEQAPLPHLMVFAGDNYYPRGGMRDLIGWASSEDEARAMIFETSDNYDWWQVFDAVTRQEVLNGYRR